MKVLPKKFRLILRNFTIVFLLFSFLSLPLAPIVRSQTSPAINSSTNQAVPEPYVSQNTSNQAQPIVATTSATETGAVLGFGIFDKIGGFLGGYLKCITPTPVGKIDCLKSGLDAAGGSFFDALVSYSEFMISQLFNILLRIILYLTHIGAAILNIDTSNPCAGLAGADATKCGELQKKVAAVDPLFDSDAKIPFGVFTLLDQSYSTLYANIPDIHVIDEVSYVASNNVLGIGDVHAQGQGVADLGEAVRGLWAKMRDLAYIAMVLILVVIGFMVMLRRRLDPKTVVSATNSLPKVAIALILITFSFAISGFFIDLIYIVVNIAENYFGGVGYINSWIGTLEETVGGSGLTWLPVFAIFAKPVINMGALFLLIAGNGVLAASGGPLAIVGIVGLIAVLGLEIIIRIGLFILAIMLFWTLIVRYATMIVLIIFSPFFFLAGAIPGFEGLTMNWFKRMFSSVLVFPAVLVIIYIGGYFLSIGNFFGVLGDTIGAPPPINASSYFLNIGPLIGLGILYFATKIPGAIDEVLGIKDTKQKGPTPLILASGAMGGLQTYSSINKGVTPLSSSISGLAAQDGLRGKLAGGAMGLLRPFAPGAEWPNSTQIKERRAANKVAQETKAAARLTPERGAPEYYESGKNRTETEGSVGKSRLKFWQDPSAVRVKRTDQTAPKVAPDNVESVPNTSVPKDERDDADPRAVRIKRPGSP